MLIKLLPEAPNPSVLFNIAFEDFPEGMALPQAWTSVLSNLMHDELTIPTSQHALDKAAFLPCILEEVVFDLPAMSITCRFIDGSVEQWRIGLKDSEGELRNKCLKTLESVVDDVCLSTLETARERERERQREKEREREQEKEKLRLLQQASSSSFSSKGPRHKKKRSLLMTIVSSLSSLNSIINLSLPSPAIPTSSQLTPPSSTGLVSQSKLITPPIQNVCPRFLRRRARSSLVDAFRRFVLHELTNRVPQGGYYVWVLHSLLREARERRDAILIRERELERERLRRVDPPLSKRPKSSGASSNSSASGSFITFGRRKQNPLWRSRSMGLSTESDAFSATTATEPPSSDDEEEEIAHRRMGSEEAREANADSETIETDTDGSSIHTPSSSHSSLLPTHPLTLSPNLSHPNTQIPRLLTAASDPMELQIQTLTHIILLHTSHSARTAHDEAMRLDALEVRSRRRAWLNCALCPNGLRLTLPACGNASTHVQRTENTMGAGLGGLGFAVPLRRSTLGMWVVNAEDLGRQGEQNKEAHVGDVQAQCAGQSNAIMSEDQDLQAVRYADYDERNGIEPRRRRVSVPSGRIQLLPVSEEDEDGMGPEPHQNMRDGESSEIRTYDEEEDDDDPALQLSNLDLNQYDDLRGLQMDLDIVTGVGFDMDSSDEEDNDASADIRFTKGDIPEGGICVALEIPRPNALHARSPHLIPGHDQRHRQKHRQRACNMVNQSHPVHQYQHPNIAASSFQQHYVQDLHIPQRCQTPLPQYPPPGIPQPSFFSVESKAPTNTISGDSDSPPTLTSISIPQPAYLRAHRPPPYPPPAIPDTLPPYNSSNPPSSTIPSLEPNSCPTLASKCKMPLSNEIYVNDVGQIIAAATVKEEEGEEFTLAMDLPSKSLSSRFGEMTFAAMGRTKSFRGRVRGASKIRDHGDPGEEVERSWV